MNNIWNYFKHRYEPLTRVNVVHFNDMHENINHIDSFITAHDEFYKQHEGETNLTLAGGDIFNRFPQDEKIVGNFVKNYVDASATGNRDLEKGKRLSKTIAKYGLEDKFIGTNVRYTSKNPLQNQLAHTKIINNSIGIIGLAPVDFAPRWKRKDNTNIQTQDLEDTINTIKAEVNKLEEQGINKIFLLAHTGEFSGHNINDRHDIDYYKKFAEIGGIDVIIGGHDHRKTNRWETSSRNEPVKIVSTGNDNNTVFTADLNEIGELELIFDKNGILQKNLCKNKFIKTDNYTKTEFVEQFPHKFINIGKLTEKAVSKFFKLKFLSNQSPNIIENNNNH